MINNMNSEVLSVFNSYSQSVRDKLMIIRQMIVEIANSTDRIGELEETLRWNEPSYITSTTKSGSTIRIAQIESQSDQYAIYFICTTNLVEEFKERYPHKFKYGGNRSLIFNIHDEIPKVELKNCLTLALTYHLNKKLAPSARWEMVEKITSQAQ